MCKTLRPNAKRGRLSLRVAPADESDDDLMPSARKPLFRGSGTSDSLALVSLTSGSPADEGLPRLRRSNSVNSLGQPLSIAERYSSNGLKSTTYTDFSIIAAFSREASEQFAKSFGRKMIADSPDLATLKSRVGVTYTEAMSMIGRQKKLTLGSDFEQHVEGLLENKTVPHVIAVIEGKQEAKTISIKTRLDGHIEHVSFIRVSYVQGVNANEHNDNKQSFNVYVREDMQKVYSVSVVDIPYSHTQSIKAVAVDYKTEDNITYQSLIVHIPNGFIGSKSKEINVYNLFQNYALAQEQAPLPVRVVSILGDTNFITPFETYSSPSIGGHLSSGKTLSPQSSSASYDTNFMQSIPLHGLKPELHSVLQPSTLNYLFVTPDKLNREAVDHPSIIQYVAHTSNIAGTSRSSRPLDFMPKP